MNYRHSEDIALITQDQLELLIGIFQASQELINQGIEPKHVVAAAQLACSQDQVTEMADKIWVMEQMGLVERNGDEVSLTPQRN
jgi:hypothetical protein